MKRANVFGTFGMVALIIVLAFTAYIMLYPPLRFLWHFIKH